jgi:hypothetical protein
MAKRTGKPAGRPTAWRDCFLAQAKELAMLGLTDAQMASVFGISLASFHGWKKTKEGFLDSLNAGKVFADAKVAKSLYERAVGYSHPEDDIRVVGLNIVITPTTKHYPPDPTSMIFWLKNRQPELWREKAQAEKSEDLAKIMEKLAKDLPS